MKHLKLAIALVIVSAVIVGITYSLFSVIIGVWCFLLPITACMVAAMFGAVALMWATDIITVYFRERKNKRGPQ